MTTRSTGGCMCGAVRYECGTDPIAMGNCHCRDCQRATGSAFAAAVLVPVSAVKITGEVKYYEVIGDSGGIVRRGFCPNCGARLFGQSAASAGGISIMAGTLDDSSWFMPKRTSTQPARSRGTTCIRICRSSPGRHRHSRRIEVLR